MTLVRPALRRFRSGLAPRVARAAALLTLLLIAAAARAADPLAAAVASLLDVAGPGESLYVACERIHARSDLVQFYRERGFTAVWVEPGGPTPLHREFLETLRGVSAHGLHPEQYHLACLEAGARRFREQSDRGQPPLAAELAEQDVVMTDAFLTFGSHLDAGKVDPESLYPLWVSRRGRSNVVEVLRDLARSRDLSGALTGLSPAQPGYRQMIAAAAELRRVAGEGGWPALRFERVLETGMRDPVVPRLRQRLRVSGDLPGAAAPGDADERFDPDLEVAVRRFQARHGIASDGIVGPQTRAALNVPAEMRWRQLVLNLERWRWLPHRREGRYLWVNAADFSLQAYDGGRQALDMRVIVGEAYQKTPVFSQPMTYLEINPYWNVPPSIAREEFLPRIQKAPRFLAAGHYELLAGWGDKSAVLDPASIRWDRVTPETFPGRLRQLPGPWNTLGRIKFMFPNRFNVYLHDTPARSLFLRTNRALSHGCIRVERPIDLAAFVLRGDPAWSPAAIEGAIAAGERRVVTLPRPCMVHLLYLTAWVGADGEVEFRDDVYDRDARLWDALEREPGDEVGVTESAGDPGRRGN